MRVNMRRTRTGWHVFPWLLLLLAILALGVAVGGARQGWADTIQPSSASETNDIERFHLPEGSWEVVAKRTVESRTYRRPEGTYTTIWERDLNFEDANGNIQKATQKFNAQGVAATDAMVYGNALHLQDVEGNALTWILPDVDRTIDGNLLTFTDDGVQWQYSKLNGGVKLEGLVETSRGLHEYSFPFQATGDLTMGADGSINGDGFSIPAPFVRDSYGRIHQFDWELAPNELRLVFDDALIPAPYMIDPTTIFALAVGADDGQTQGFAGSYPPGCILAFTTATNLTASKSFGGGFYSDDVILIQWNTAAIGATSQINSASFIYAQQGSVTDADTRNLNGEWYSASNWPIDCSDHVGSVGTTAFTTALTAFPASPIALGTLSGISQTGYTGIRLGVSGGAPTGTNTIAFVSFEGTGVKPQLSVTYDLMSVDSVDNTPVAANGTKSFTATGDAFTGVTAVRLEKVSESNINCTAVSVVDDENVDFDCNLTGAAEGAWDIVVIKPTGLATGAGLLDIHVLEIISVVPTSDTPTAVTAFTMDGDGMDTGIQAKLTKSGESDINCTAEAVTLPLIRMTANCDLTGVAEGFWDLTITNTDTTSVTLLNATFLSLSLVLQVANVASGEHALKLDSDGTDMFLYLDGEIVDSTYYQWAMEFNGASGDVDLGSPAVLDNIFASGGTVEAWIRPDSDGEASLGRIFHKAQWALRVAGEDELTVGFMRIVFFHTFSTTTGSWDSFFTSIPTGVYTHVAVTYDKDSAANDPIFYINGIPINPGEGVTPVGTADDDSASSWIVGNKADDTLTFNGTIDDIRAWDDIRTPAEILANYTIKLVGNEAGLVGYWPVDIGTGAILDDDTANSNDGTITTATWRRTVNLLMESDNPPHNPPVVNANDWEMFVNNAMPYVNFVKITLASVLSLHYEMDTLPGLLLVDRSGEGNDAIARYPDTPAGFVIGQSSVQATLPDNETPGLTEVLGDTPAISGFSDADTTSTNGFFLFDIMANTSFPYQALVAMFAMGIIILFALVTAKIFNEALPVGIVITLGLIIFWKMGALPGWMPILFSIGPLIFFLVWKKATP